VQALLTTRSNNAQSTGLHAHNARTLPVMLSRAVVTRLRRLPITLGVFFGVPSLDVDGCGVDDDKSALGDDLPCLSRWTNDACQHILTHHASHHAPHVADVVSVRRH
jgi:hypothetical protein